MPTFRRSPRRSAAVAAIALTVAIGAGCSGAGGDPDSSAETAQSGTAGGSDAGTSARDQAPAAFTGGPDSAGKAAPRALTRGRTGALARAIAYVGELRVEVDDVSKATLAATAQVRGAGGLLFAQDSSLGDDASALLTFKVPPAQFDRLLGSLADLGRPQGRTVSAEDITEQLVDLDARLRTAKASADRVRALLARAGTITEIVALEREVASREAEVESMTARLRALDGRVEEATLTLLLSADRSTFESDDDERGFLAGLRRGWRAFTASAAVGATALGAVLPFAAVAALVAWGAIAVRRRRGRLSTAAPSA